MKKIFLQILLLHVIIFSKINGANPYLYTNYYNDGSVTFKMWVPPTTNQVRGLLLIFNQMMDNPASDSLVRLACSVEDIAIVYIYNTGDTGVIMNGITQLSVKSGFPEVAHAPFVTLGHSAAAILAKDMAYWFPSRCFGVIQLNGVKYEAPSGVTTEIDSIPFMSVKNMNEPTGDNWLQAKELMLTNYRSKGYQSHIVSQPGGGHFGWTSFEAKLISMFIQKAAHYQIPYDVVATGGQVKLTRMTEEEGWLADTAMASVPAHSPAPYNDYTGDKSKAFWLFDGEYASLWATLHATEYAKLPQVVTQSSFTCSHPWANCTPQLTFGTQSTVSVTASSTSGLALKYQPYYHAYKVQNDIIYLDAARRAAITNNDWITIYQPGNSTYRYGETMIKITVNNKTSGTSQSISFTNITDKNFADPVIPFDATASSALDVQYYIASGALEKSGSTWLIQDFSTKNSDVVIFYGQPGDATYATAASQSDLFTIVNSRVNDSITFAPIPDKVSTDAPFSLSSTTASGDTVKYILFSGPGTLNNKTITLSGDTGTLVIMAYVPGSATRNGSKKVQYVKVAEPSVSIKYISNNKASVFPNPATSYINISLSGHVKGALVTLYNIQGMVFIKKHIEDSISLDVSSLEKGVYLVDIENGLLKETHKVIVQ